MKPGQKVTISVAEPWDFESPDGDNIFHGTVYQEATYGRLIEVDHPFVLDGVLITFVLATPRRGNADDGRFNIYHLPKELVPTFDKLQNERALKFIIIGHLVNSSRGED